MVGIVDQRRRRLADQPGQPDEPERRGRLPTHPQRPLRLHRHRHRRAGRAAHRVRPRRRHRRPGRRRPDDQGGLRPGPGIRADLPGGRARRARPRPDRSGDGRPPGVAEVHDLHIWDITSGLPALSAHVLVDPTAIAIRSEGTSRPCSRAPTGSITPLCRLTTRSPRTLAAACSIPIALTRTDPVTSRPTSQARRRSGRHRIDARLWATRTPSAPATWTSGTPSSRRRAGQWPADAAPADATGLHDSTVVLSDGERINARCVVIATDGPTAHDLLGARVPDPGSRAAACCWFSAPSAPIAGPVLILDGDASGPAKNVAVMSEVAPSSATTSQALVAAAIPGPEALDPGLTGRVREQLARWFGSVTTDWEHLRTDVIPHGQPSQNPPLHPKRAVALGDGMFVCGDHRDTASIQGAMFSGGRTATAVLEHLRGRSASREHL